MRKKCWKTFIVKPVCDFVADDDPDAAIVQGLGEVLTVEQRLQNSGWKNWKRKSQLIMR